MDCRTFEAREWLEAGEQSDPWPVARTTGREADRLDFAILQALQDESRAPAPADLGLGVLERLRAGGLIVAKRPAPSRLRARALLAFLALFASLCILQATDLDLETGLRSFVEGTATWTYARVHGKVTVATLREALDPGSFIRVTGATLTAAAGLVAASNLGLWGVLALTCTLLARALGVPPWPRSRTVMRSRLRIESRPTFLLAVVIACSVPTLTSAVGEPAGRRDRFGAGAADSSASEAGSSAAKSRRESSHPAPRRKTAGYDMVKLGERVHIHTDEVVRGDIVALGGGVRVEGEVTGNVVVVGGDLDAGPEAHIGGQALALGGRVEAATGAHIEGGIVSLSLLPSHWFRDRDRGRLASAGRLLGQIVRLALFLVAAAFLIAVFPRRITRATAMMGHAFLRCFGLGVLALTGGLFAVSVASVLLAITLVGIPLALLLACGTTLLLMASWIVGATLVGERLLDPGGDRRVAPFVAAATGLLVLLAPQFLADLIRGMSGSPPLGMTLRLAYAALILTVLATGLGAVLFSRLGSESATAPELRSAAFAAIPTSIPPVENTSSI